MPFLNKKFSMVRMKIVFSYFCTLVVLELATLTKKVIFKYFISPSPAPRQTKSYQTLIDCDEATFENS